MTKHKVQVPGELEGDTAPAVAPDAELAALRAELAELKSAAKLPQPVFEPSTPHGAQKLAESEFASMTTAQLTAKIAAGEVERPRSGVLCADGWFA